MTVKNLSWEHFEYWIISVSFCTIHQNEKPKGLIWFIWPYIRWAKTVIYSLSHLQIPIHTVTVTLSAVEVSAIFRYWFDCIRKNHIFDIFREKPAENLIFVYFGDSLALWKVLSISWHVTIELIRLYTHCLFQDFRDLWKSFKNV